jgi:hypothetical protein
MQKKYIVRLSKEERNTLREVVKNLKGGSQKVRRAQILLKADADGPAWNDSRIADHWEDVLRRLVDAQQNHHGDLAPAGSPYLLDLLPDRWALTVRGSSISRSVTWV